MEEKTSREVVRMPAWSQSALEGKIASLNKRAVKLGCREMVLSFVGAEPKEVTHTQDGRKLLKPYYIPMLDATLEYVIPRVNGYHVVAGMDLVVTDAVSVVLVSPVPGETVPAMYQSKTAIGCEHCNTARFRKHSILLQHDDGHYKEVGTTCVKDFFGHDPKGLMMMASIVFSDIVLSLDGDGEYFGSQRERVCKLEDLLSVTSAVIRNFGWLGRTKANENGGMASVDIALENMYSPQIMKEIQIDGVTDGDKSKAKMTIQHFQDLDPGDNDYLINCCKIADLGLVPQRYQGYAASMVFSYDLHLQRDAEESNQLPSEWVGEVGKRLKKIEVTVSFRRDLVSDWGTSELYGFVDENGNEYKTFYSGGSWSAEQGDKGLVTGTVKKHEIYNGRKQTMLSRTVFDLVEGGKNG